MPQYSMHYSHSTYNEESTITVVHWLLHKSSRYFGSMVCESNCIVLHENFAKRHRTQSSRDEESRLIRSGYYYCFSVHTRSLWGWRRRALAYNEEAYGCPKGDKLKKIRNCSISILCLPCIDSRCKICTRASRVWEFRWRESFPLTRTFLLFAADTLVGSGCISAWWGARLHVCHNCDLDLEEARNL